MTDETRNEATENNVQVVEKRVKKNVIRRRRKTVETAPETTEAAPETTAAAPERPAVRMPKGAAPAVVPPKRTGVTAEAAQKPAVDAPEQQDPENPPTVASGVTLAKPTEAERKIGVVGHIDLDTVKPSEPSAPAREREEWRERQQQQRGTRRRKSRAELEMEAIQRAGGLKQYAGMFGREEPGGGTGGADRVFRPGPSGKRRRVRKEGGKKPRITEPKAIKKIIRVDEAITVGDLSQALGVKANELIRKLMGMEVMATINKAVDVDTASLLAEEYGFTVEHTGFKEEDILVEPEAHASSENIAPRAPVVTVMGHVDHGKTSILDVIRKSDVASGEAGGITQHIGAYEVTMPNGKITFIDTPGHEAFTTMRARGAQVTDLVIIVVAADDGVMPQTIEAIDHAKAAGVPIIVAVNKIDKADAQPDRVKQALTEHGLVPEEWGGDIICVNTSAKSGEGIDQLLEMILLQSEMLELEADPTIRPKGVVVEAKLERGRGPVATVLIQEGTLRKGDYLVCGTYEGKVRTMFAADGTEVKEAGLSKPVGILGLSGVPEAGDEMVGVEDERAARLVAEQRREKERERQLHRPVHASLDDLAAQLEAAEAKELKVIIKGDVHGSVEAVREALEKLSTEKVKLTVLHTQVGGVTESDVMLASASDAIIVGFNVQPDGKARRAAENEGVEIRTYRIIYEMLDEMRKAMEGLLAPIEKEAALGQAEVREVFRVSKVGTIAGCHVVDGIIRRNARARLLRDQVVVFDGEISSLKRFKEDAREVAEGYECGIGLANFNDVKVGDLIEAYIIEQTAATL